MDCEPFHPNIEKHVTRAGEHRVWSPELGCAHDWVRMPADVEERMHIVSPERGEDCTKCGAWCVRDDKTHEMLEYELPSAFEPPPAFPSAKKAS